MRANKFPLVWALELLWYVEDRHLDTYWAATGVWDRIAERRVYGIPSIFD